uniref:Uncharacterized protein n=1 Tax=Arundo donax TaxID=35708 RepID=A0A0A9CCX0_ARUDO
MQASIVQYNHGGGVHHIAHSRCHIALHTGFLSERTFCCCGVLCIKRSKPLKVFMCMRVCLFLKGQIMSMQMGCRGVRGGVKHWECACVGFCPRLYRLLPAPPPLKIGFGS